MPKVANQCFHEIKKIEKCQEEIVHNVCIGKKCTLLFPSLCLLGDIICLAELSNITRVGRDHLDTIPISIFSLQFFPSVLKWQTNP